MTAESSTGISRRRRPRGRYPKTGDGATPKRQKRIPEYLEADEVNAIIRAAPNPKAKLLMLEQWRAGLWEHQSGQDSRGSSCDRLALGAGGGQACRGAWRVCAWEASRHAHAAPQLCPPSPNEWHPDQLPQSVAGAFVDSDNTNLPGACARSDREPCDGALSGTDQICVIRQLSIEGMFDMRLLGRLFLLTLFIVGSAALAVQIYAYWIVDITPNDVLNWSMLGLTGGCVAVMVVLAVATKDMVTRWLSAGLIGVVALGFSALTIISIGILIAPFALALTVISCFMLIRNVLSSASIDSP